MEFSFSDLSIILDNAKISNSDKAIERIINKIDSQCQLNDFEAAVLLYAPDRFSEIIFERAKHINEKLFNKTIKLYGVSYLSDFCMETCKYCGDNVYSKRKDWDEIINFSTGEGILKDGKHLLSVEAFKKDIEYLLAKFPEIKQICLLSGDTPSLDISRWQQYLTAINEIYSKKIILNIPPMSICSFEKLRNTIPNTLLQFRVFQETYDEQVYKRQHPEYNFKNKRTTKLLNFLYPKKQYNSQKSNFWFRAYSQERAILSGFDEVGLGVLLGLNDGAHGPFFEVLALKRHTEYLKNKYGIIPKTISFPRIRPSSGINFKVPRNVSDKEMIRLIAVTKLAIPQSEIIITCRERAEFRRKLRPIINIEDFEARPGPGGNMAESIEGQMEIADLRKGSEVIDEIKSEGFNIK